MEQLLKGNIRSMVFAASLIVLAILLSQPVQAALPTSQGGESERNGWQTNEYDQLPEGYRGYSTTVPAPTALATISPSPSP